MNIYNDEPIHELLVDRQRNSTHKYDTITKIFSTIADKYILPTFVQFTETHSYFTVIWGDTIPATYKCCQWNKLLRVYKLWRLISVQRSHYDTWVRF